MDLTASVSLKEFVRTHFGSEPVPPPPDVQGSATRARSRELLLRAWLPAWIVRRVDRGFARSNTVAPDTASALYAIVRGLHARMVIETGTYWGFSTAILAAAVRDEGGGMVHSFDIYPRAGAHIPPPLMRWITLHRGRPSSEALPELLLRGAPDLFFQDSRHDYAGVTEELRLVAPRLRPGGVILFHDWVLPEVRQAAQDELGGWALAQVAGDDPQQLGAAVKPRSH